MCLNDPPWQHAVKELVWERPLQIIKYPDPRLRAVNARIGVFDERVKQFGQELLEVMYNGSAALQDDQICGSVLVIGLET